MPESTLSPSQELWIWPLVILSHHIKSARVQFLFGWLNLFMLPKTLYTFYLLVNADHKSHVFFVVEKKGRARIAPRRGKETSF
jgi:hypothetical protein